MPLRSSLFLALTLASAACSDPHYATGPTDDGCDDARCADALRDGGDSPDAEAGPATPDAQLPPRPDAQLPPPDVTSPSDAGLAPDAQQPMRSDAERMLGRYAVRAQFFGTDRNAMGVITHETLYLADVTRDEQTGSLQLDLQPCADRGEVSASAGLVRFTVSVPQAERLPPRKLKLVLENGSFRTEGPPTPVGYTVEPPATCMAGREITRPNPVPWGTTCVCPSDLEVPPTKPSDCRVIDADGDGEPGFTSRAIGAVFGGSSGIRTKDLTQLVKGVIADSGRHTAALRYSAESAFLTCGSTTCRNANLTLCEDRHNTVEFAPLPALAPSGQAFQCRDVRAGIEAGELMPTKPLAFPTDC